MICPNCKKVIPDDSERCPECLVNIEAFNRETELYGTNKRSKFIGTVIMTIFIVSIVLTIIFCIFQLYFVAILIFVLMGSEIFFLKIAETIIDLLQEISQKMDR